MRGLGKLVADLARHKQSMDAAFRAGEPARRQGSRASRLAEVTDFGSNPGDLRMFVYAPAELAPRPGLVVVLHGCTQTAAGYEVGAGWSTLAERYGFVLLMPEQQSANNPKTCFSWFLPEDTTREQGEVHSIRQMVDRAVADHGVDPSRIFVTGLSAGGAMAGAMLATYPEVFAGGAIIAGLPYGSASNVREAFQSMFQGTERTAKQWGDLVRKASPHKGPWPRVSIWHGTADTTVKPGNAHEILKQWTNVHGLPLKPAQETLVDGHPRRVWTAPDGTELIEDYNIKGMAHGLPLGIKGAEQPFGQAGPFMLDVGIASSYHIARFWGLTEGGPLHGHAPAPSPVIHLPEGPARAPSSRPGPAPVAPGVQDVITRALKAAGLMRD